MSDDKSTAAAATAAATATAAIVGADIAYIKKDLGEIKTDIHEMKMAYVSKAEFDPVRKVVYGLVAAICLAFLAWVFRNGGR